MKPTPSASAATSKSPQAGIGARDARGVGFTQLIVRSFQADTRSPSCPEAPTACRPDSYLLPDDANNFRAAADVGPVIVSGIGGGKHEPGSY